MISVPPPAVLLNVWEQAAGWPQAHRTVALLRAADPAMADTDVAHLTVGEADQRLLALRDAAFGSRFDAVSRCPQCSESIELRFRTGDFPAEDAAARAPLALETAGMQVEFRLPTLTDLAEAARAADAAAARALLLCRCITSARTSAGEVVDPATLEPHLVDAVGAALEHADPLACTRLELRCPACAHTWSSVFDVSAYLWMELDNWAKGILREVHLLARAYGWSEAEILSLSVRRRREYLEMVVS